MYFDIFQLEKKFDRVFEDIITKIDFWFPLNHTEKKDFFVQGILRNFVSFT